MSQHHFQRLLFWINIVSTSFLYSGKRNVIFLSSLLPYSPVEHFQFSEVERDLAVCVFCYERGAWNARVNDMRSRASLPLSSPRLGFQDPVIVSCQKDTFEFQCVKSLRLCFLGCKLQMAFRNLLNNPVTQLSTFYPCLTLNWIYLFLSCYKWRNRWS